jgi:hypothetical protein
VDGLEITEYLLWIWFGNVHAIISNINAINKNQRFSENFLTKHFKLITFKSVDESLNSSLPG